MADVTNRGKQSQPRDGELAQRKRALDIMRLRLTIADNEVIIMEREQDIANRRKAIEDTQARIAELKQEDQDNG